MKYFLTIMTLVALTIPVYASEVTGTITTGLSTGGGVEGIVVESPTASPGADTYTSNQSVTLSGGEGTGYINYTTDGSRATCSSGETYTSPISVTSSVVIEAILCYANNISSDVAIFGYAINPPSAPAPSGGGGGGGGGGIITTTSNSSQDFNEDGKVDIFDFNALITNWGSTSATKAEGDADGDGDVDIFDFNLLISSWEG